MSDDIVKRGYLHHQVSVTSCFRHQLRWNRVFLLLKDGCLFLYASPRDLHPLQSVPLYASCCLFPQWPKVTRSNCLQVETPTASIMLCADTPADIKEWAICLQRAAIVASGGSIGKLHGGGGGGGSAFQTPQGQLRGLGSRSLPSQSLAIDYPADITLPPAVLASHSVEAASMIADAATAASYDRVLRRFRDAAAITAFTSSTLACVAPNGGYAVYRGQAKRRVAQEWLWETREHTLENQRRQTAPLVPTPLESYQLPSFGTLNLASSSVPLRRGTASLKVTNTAEYPVCVRAGDSLTAAWLRTNTPIFIRPLATTTITFDVRSPATSSPNGSTSSSTASSSAAAAALSPPPSLPWSVPLLLKACDSTELASGQPRSLFELDDGSPSHRIGEMCVIEIV